MIKVEGHSNLVTNESGAVVVTNKSAVLNKVAKLRAEKQKFEQLQTQVDTIQTMLNQILEKLDGNNK